ncbi:acetyl-CoA carboxylase biotin carboxyl carrier protein [Fructobacillus sp. M1-13]|uniref:Biotin carboxyl carrier protein of acetyl-CoA carboxylase n=1 Tax=Fructobacillus papyriferae TaxID=2713171 RepID=A0ABS5QQ06_9LACO|nr:acetyl-CoA carboxylase biotin carboxyl carrier protein [Fructobacillus papyriferae]MBS9335260.1 acetyl-CoA carboxylase biotin carboxyl carrier protein [Fructobacillus papyriferae]MCD2159071.1 acetyl-CoA carboxylase biotin carboxyl carrier protein [Fructobacillus papyriferae]
MNLNVKEIRELMADLEKSSLRDIAIQDGDFSLHLSKNEQVATQAPVAAPAPAEKKAATTAAPAADAASVAAPAEDAPTAPAAGKEIKAPMVGTVYLKPKPDQPDFKSVGDHVEKGETVAIIEAMKLMTEIKADVSGTIAEILVENEEVVDYDKPLYRVTTD